MARRVNTKFVVILSAALVGAVGVFGGVWYYHRMQRQNPDFVRAQGEAAEKSGDLKGAVINYSNAAALMSIKHISGADALFARAAELGMKVSREAQTQEDAVRFYQFALDNYKRALQENPRNKQVNITLMEEDYQNAQFQPSIPAWKTVEEVAGKLIVNQNAAALAQSVEKRRDLRVKLDDSQASLTDAERQKITEDLKGLDADLHQAVKPLLYRAEARIRISGSLSDSATTAALAEIHKDIDAALQLEPSSGKAVALQGQLLWLEAGLSASRRGLSKSDEFIADEQYQRDVAVVRQMLISYLEGRQSRTRSPGWVWFTRVPLDHIDADVASTLSTMTIDQFRQTGNRDRSRLDAAIVLLDAAFATDSSKTNLADMLGTLYLATGQSEKTEALYKQLVLKTPEKPEVYYRLASFYRDTGKLPEAIAAFTDVTAHPLVGMGREARRNQEYQIVSINEIAWLNLELSERPGADPAKVKEYLKVAADYTEKLRAANAHKGLIDLLDGRTMLLKRDIPHAVVSLRSAEANLNGANNAIMVEKYRQTELLLAQANEMQNQLGAALELINKALEIRPGEVPVILQKARLLMRLGRYSETRLLMGRLLGDSITVTGDTVKHEFVNEKNLPKDLADRAREIWYTADALDSKKPDALKMLPGQTLRIAMIAFDMGDYSSAMTDAMIVLEKAASNTELENTSAYQIAINCGVQLKLTEQSRKLAAEALAKYPQNTTFQILKARLDLPEGADTLAAQQAVIDAVTDPYIKAVSLAALHHRQRKYDDEIKVLQTARDALKNSATPEDREKLNGIYDRLFTAAITAASTTPTPATGAAPSTAQVATSGPAMAPAEYWKLAQSIVTDLEKLNLDGTDGKIYRGRLELAQSGGKKGLQFLQQAVAQRPDYAYAHLVLGQAHLVLANISTANGAAASTANTNAALEELRQVVRLAPNNILALQLAINILVSKGDSSSLKEAQTLLEDGLRQAPHNSILISYTEIFAEKVDDSIKMREELLSRQPDDRNNIRRLAGLYVRLKDKETDPEKKQAAMKHAIALVYGDFQKHQTELQTADVLARLFVEYDKSEQGAAAAVQLYAMFIDGKAPAEQFEALIAKAEFFRNLTLHGNAIVQLLKARVIGNQLLWDKAAGDRLEERDVSNALKQEAVGILKAAINIEPKEKDDAERHLADMYFDLGQMEEAEKQYQIVLDKKMNVGTLDKVNRRLIESELRLGKYPEAQPRLDALLKKTPDDIQGLILRAYAVIQQAAKQTTEEQQKALKTAQADLNRVLTLDPGNPDALFYRATAQISLGDRLDEAENDLIQAAKRDRGAVNSRVLLAELYARTQRYEESSREYRGILKDHPDMLTVRVEYTDLLKSLTDLQLSLPADSDVDFVVTLRKLDPAKKLAEEIQEGSVMYPAQPRWWFLFAQLLSSQGKHAEAQRYYKALYDTRPTEAQICDAYMGSLLKTHDYAKVVELGTTYIDLGLKVNPLTNKSFFDLNPQFVSFFLKRAAAYQGLDRPEEAVKDVDRGLALGVVAANDSNNFSPFIVVLNELSIRDPSDKGVLTPELVAERLRVRIAANPNETVSSIGLIQTLLLMNNAQGAAKVADTLTPPASNETLRFLVYREKALVHSQLKEYDAAEKDYQELLKMAPSNVDVLNNYAYTLAEWGKAREAILLAERALKFLSTRSEPGLVTNSAANVYDTLGYAYYVNNDPLNAIANLGKSIKVQPQAQAYLHLALAYQKNNQIDESQQKCLQGIKLALAKHDDETLAALKELQTKLAAAAAPAAARP